MCQPTALLRQGAVGPSEWNSRFFKDRGGQARTGKNSIRSPQLPQRECRFILENGGGQGNLACPLSRSRSSGTPYRRWTSAATDPHESNLECGEIYSHGQGFTAG